MSGSLHDQLVRKAVTYLRRSVGCVVVCSELGAGWGWPEVPDVVGWNGKRSYVVECKSSRDDFLRDRRKRVRRSPAEGMGELRYYCAWPGVVRVGELPSAWGLLEAGRGLVQRWPAEVQVANGRAEVAALVSVVRRGLGQGLSVRWYKWSTCNRTRVVVPPVRTSERTA